MLDGRLGIGYIVVNKINNPCHNGACSLLKINRH